MKTYKAMISNMESINILHFTSNIDMGTNCGIGKISCIVAILSIIVALTSSIAVMILTITTNTGYFQKIKPF